MSEAYTHYSDFVYFSPFLSFLWSGEIVPVAQTAQPEQKGFHATLTVVGIMLLWCKASNENSGTRRNGIVRIAVMTVVGSVLMALCLASARPRNSSNRSKGIAREKSSRRPKVVILAGPHKTGTTGVQTCLVDLSIRAQHLEEWLWAIPSPQELRDVNLTALMPQKQFAPLLAVLRHANKFRAGAIDENAVLEIYRQRITTAWMEGHYILYGAEAMDFIVSEQHNGSEIMDGVLSILPWNETPPLTRDDIEVVVGYRAPRSTHLVSVWHEQSKPNQTLSDFLTNPQGSMYIFQSNSLGLALKFLERGLPTTVLDISGVDAKSISICEAIACDVLKVTCTEDYQILSMKNQTIRKFNNVKAGRGEMDLTQGQLDSIDRLMTDYDCGLRQTILALHPRILFQKQLFSSCPDDALNQSFSWLVQSIQNIAAGR